MKSSLPPSSRLMMVPASSTARICDTPSWPGERNSPARKSMKLSLKWSSTIRTASIARSSLRCWRPRPQKTARLRLLLKFNVLLFTSSHSLIAARRTKTTTTSANNINHPPKNILNSTTKSFPRYLLFFSFNVMGVVWFWFDIRQLSNDYFQIQFLDRIAWCGEWFLS